MNSPKPYIIAGCNGAGKTTASLIILPQILKCTEFVNADEIAKGISPFNPEEVIRRRYWAGLQNLFNIYIGKVDTWSLFDNTSLSLPIVKNSSIVDEIKLNKIIESCQNKKKIEISEKIVQGIQEAQRRLFERKAKLDKKVVIGDDNNNPILVTATEALLLHNKS